MMLDLMVVRNSVVKLILFLLVIRNHKRAVVIKGLLSLIVVLIVIVVDGVACMILLMLVIHQMFSQLRCILLWDSSSNCTSFVSGVMVLLLLVAVAVEMRLVVVDLVVDLMLFSRIIMSFKFRICVEMLIQQWRRRRISLKL